MEGKGGFSFMKNLIVLEGDTMYDNISLFGLHSPTRRVGNLGWSVKKAVRKTVAKVTAPAVQAVQRIEAKAVAAVQPAVAKVEERVNEQVARAAAVADQLGAEKLQELKNKAIQMAKDPAVQGAAIMAAATACGAPEMGQQLAQANIQAQAAYQDYNAMIEASEAQRAIAQISANPTSVQAAQTVATTRDPLIRNIASQYAAQLDSRATSAALRSSGLSETTGLKSNNKLIFALLGVGAVIFLLAGRK